MSNISDSHQHVVKTSAQWNERAIEYWIVPRGCLCVELTARGKTKLKVGEGNKNYYQLPYICNHEDLSDYYTKEEIDNLFNNLNRMAIMSTDEYDSRSDLPRDGNKLGDVRFVKSQSPSIKIDPDLYVWNGTKWIFVGSPFDDISQFVTRDEFNVVKDKVDEIYPKAHTHSNKPILDSITQEDREKFDSLHNYDDTEIRRMIEEGTHTHPNKPVLDQITQQDLDKLDSLHNYDDTEIKHDLFEQQVSIDVLETKAHTHSNKRTLDRITDEMVDNLDTFAQCCFEIKNDIRDLKDKAHVHQNKDILDLTTASYTLEDKQILYDLYHIGAFLGAGPNWDGTMGYVPAPEHGMQTFFLRADGTWSKVKTGGDKYKAGEGIYILSGEVATDTFPFKVYSKSAKLKQYVIYGAIGGVGDMVSSSPRVFNIPITVTSDDYGTRQSIITTSDPLYEGDYIDYSRQVFVHTRTNIMSQLRVDPSYTYKTGIYADGTIGYFNPGAYGDMPNVTAPFELDAGAVYEIPAFSTWTNTTVWTNFNNGIHVNMYDANMNRTRTISLSFDNATLITPTASEKYLRMTCWRDSGMTVTQPAFIQIKDVETPVILQEVVLYPNTINTIDVDTTIKPSEIYVEVDDPPDEESDDPMSEYTGIIYNDGVIDVEQDETDLNTLIFHYRDEVTKSFTIPGGGGSGNYVAGDGISIEPESPLRVTHIKWVLLDMRDRASAGNIIQVGEFQLYDTNDQLISYSSINGIFGNGTSPTYGTNQYPQTPDKLIDGDWTRKMCCTNFTTNCGGLEITMELVTPIDVHDLKQYRYITGNDSPERDPVSWTLYASTDGSTWELIDTRNNETISTVRTTPTDDYVITQNTNLAINNEGVVDITQEDPNNLNELTVHFRDTTSTITVPGTEYTAGTGIQIGGNIIYNRDRRIPSDIYRQVGYIESDGTGYIMTNMIPTGRTYYQFRYRGANDPSYPSGAVFGENVIVNGNNRNGDAFFDYWNNGPVMCTLSGNDSGSGYYTSSSQPQIFNHDMVINHSPAINATDTYLSEYNGNGGWNYDSHLVGYGLGYGTSKGSSTQPIAIFGVNTYDMTNDTHTVENLRKGRFYMFAKFEGALDNNHVTNDLRPCYRLSDDKIGLYDAYTNTFFPCTNDSAFTCGPDLVDIVPVEGNVISAKLGKGLTVDSTYGNITNAGVLDIIQDQLSPNTLTVKFVNSQKNITIPGGSGGNNNYRAGDGIEITTIYPPQQGFQVEDTDYYFDTNVQCTIGGRTFTKYTTDPALGVICHARINSGGGQSTVFSGPMFFGLSENAVKVHNDYSGGQTEGSMGTFEYKGYRWYISAHNYMNDGTTIVDGGIPRIDDLVFTFDGNGEIELGKMVIDLAGLITDPIDEFSAKLGDGLQFDANGAIEVVGGSYTASHGIEIISDDIEANLGDALTFDENDAITLDEATKFTFHCNNDPD